MFLDASGIAQFAAAAGFSGDDLITAVAVALAESGGKVDAEALNGEGSYGLWQIYVHDHPEYANVNLYDPAVNAAAAFAIYQAAGDRFQPWSAYKNHSYLRYLPRAQAAVLSGDGAEIPLPMPAVSSGWTAPAPVGISPAAAAGSQGFPAPGFHLPAGFPSWGFLALGVAGVAVGARAVFGR